MARLSLPIARDPCPRSRFDTLTGRRTADLPVELRKTAAFDAIAVANNDEERGKFVRKLINQRDEIVAFVDRRLGISWKGR